MTQRPKLAPNIGARVAVNRKRNKEEITSRKVGLFPKRKLRITTRDDPDGITSMVKEGRQAREEYQRKADSGR
jgi:hypothetical protein